MKLTVKHKLFMGFGAILALVVLGSASNYIMIKNISEEEHRLMEVRVPTVVAGLELKDGVDRSLAALRGYMILGEDQTKGDGLKAERQRAWGQIDAAQLKMDELSQYWTNERNIKRLTKLKALFAEFRQAQQEVEEVSHTPQNNPALNMLITEAAPRASKIMTAITHIIDEESTLGATPERKALLKILADSRGSFAGGLADIRAYLLSGDAQFVDRFQREWTINETRFKQISNNTGLFNSKQAQAWKEYMNQRAEFSPLPAKMFALRGAKDWNMANYWLGTKAAPRAEAILSLLNDMRRSQERLAEKEKQALAKQFNTMEITMLVITLASLALGLFVALFISRMITVPLANVVKRAKAIAAGDLSGDILVVKGKDELADLTHAVNDMSCNLKDVVQQIAGSSQQMGSASEELSAITAQTSQSIFEQQSQTEMVASAMNEMSTTVQEVSRSVSGTAQAAEAATQETLGGQRMVEDAVKAIEQLAGQIEHASAVIHQLEEDSENINSVLEVIKGVAEQTNLLALNAAIEAARAGEQGRGFAVVADEVRTLAGRTQESTEEINGVIDKLQAGSRKAVEVMAKSREEVLTVVEQATKAGGALSEIAASVERINDMSTQIASVAEQQSATVEEINRNVTNITTMASETSTGAQQTASASGDLARLGTEMQTLVSRFKV